QRHAAERGIDVPEPTLDLTRTRAWKDSLLRDQDSWLQLLRGAGYGVYRGEASFTDANTGRVGETTLRAERGLVATGGGPRGRPADLGHRGHRVDRPHQRARADGSPRGAARRRRRAGRAGVRADLRALRLACHRRL